MKYLSVVFFSMLSFTSAAQDWKEDVYESGIYAASYTDGATGKKIIRALEEIVLINDDDTISIDIAKTDNGKVALLGIIGSGGVCLPEKAPVFISFRDGTTANFDTETIENCAGNVHIQFGGKYNNNNTLEALRKKLVQKISIGGQGGNHFYNLSTDDALNLRKTINAIIYLQTPYPRALKLF